MAKTVVYNDPILTANAINFAAYEESIRRFYLAAEAKDYDLVDFVLDHRYDVITDDQMQSLVTIRQDTHPTDYNPTGQWPFKNPKA